MRQRGFTLIEVLIVAAIVITMAAAVIGLSQGAQPFAMRSAATQFDAVVTYARALAASSGNGATIVFTRRIDGQGTVLPGFTAQIYAGRPNASGLRPAPLPRVTSGAQIWEATLGPPPFSLFFDGAGHVTGAAGAVSTATVLPSEPPCPGGGNAMTFTIRDSRASQDRALACPEAAGGTASPP